jgi:hypothetical protein
MALSDILDKFNWVDKADRLIHTVLSYLPVRASHKGRKTGAAKVRAGLTELRVDQAENPGGAAERILAQYHISVCGRRVRDREHIFSVYTRQAAWAEYVLMRAGIVFAESHKIIAPQNARQAGAHAGAVPAWRVRPPPEKASRLARGLRTLR